MNYCFKCGECERKFFDGLKVSIEEINLIEEKFNIDLFDNAEQVNNSKIYKLHGDICPFYNEEKKLCNIYEYRFCQCRLFHCGKINKEDPIINNMNDIRILMEKNEEYKNFRIKMEDAGVEWGNSHGWNWKKLI